MKRILFSLFVSALFILTAFRPEGPVIDKGAGVLCIDKKISQLKPYLVKTDKPTEGDYPSSIWELDLKKAKMETYMGQKVQRVEVGMNLGGEGEGSEEDVYYFHIYVDKPANDAAVSAFMKKLTDAYGAPMSNLVAPDSGEIVHETWFSEITLLTAIYGVDVETGNKLNYFKVCFDQAYGG